MKRFETFRDMKDQWRWRLIGGENRVLVSSNVAYDSQVDALRAADAVKGAATEAPVSDVASPGPKEVIAELIRREEARRLEVSIESNRRPPRRRSGGARRTPAGSPRGSLRVVGTRRPA
jgi:uncharacterized protein YegP (UPF0339 family)